MKAIILAGGFGTRLRPVLADVPKPMAPIDGKPFLEYLILQASAAGIRDIILAVGYMAEKICAYFGDGAKWKTSISYVRENSPLGTGGALKKACATLKDKTVIVMNGDSYFDIDFHKFIQFHKETRAEITIAVKKMRDVSRFGTILKDKKNHVTRFLEKGRLKNTSLINGGIYCVEKNTLTFARGKKFSLEKDLFPNMIGCKLLAWESRGFFVDIGTPESFQNFCKDAPPAASRLRRLTTP